MNNATKGRRGIYPASGPYTYTNALRFRNRKSNEAQNSGRISVRQDVTETHLRIRSHPSILSLSLLACSKGRTLNDHVSIETQKQGDVS